MNTKNKYPWLRHIDFLVVDLLALLLSFTIAFFIKFEGVWVISSQPEWTSSVWARLVLLLSAADVVYTLLLTPYNGIFKRKYYMEVFHALQLAALNAISVALVLYIFKIGEDYSRTVFILTYVFYFFLSLLMKFVWKKQVLAGVVRISSSKSVSLFVIARSDNIETALQNVSAGDYDPYDIKGIFLTDGGNETDHDGIPLFGSDFADRIVKENISDVFLALPPSEIGQEDYRRLIDNAVNVHISIEAMIGLQTEDQFVSDLGISKALSITSFSFRPGQLLYLGVKRVLDYIFGLIGLVLLIPITAIIKLCYLVSGDKAKIFYTQKRVGKNGREIRILKYRTMVAYADKQLEKLLENEELRREWKANQKLKN